MFFIHFIGGNSTNNLILYCLIAQEDYWLFQHPLQSANDILVYLVHAISLPRSETCSFLETVLEGYKNKLLQ